MQRIINATKSTILLMLLLGCTSYKGSISDQVNHSQADNQNLMANNTDLGDCKLPGQLRKFGRSNTFFTPGKIIKTSQVECKTRGGVFATEEHLVSVK